MPIAIETSTSTIPTGLMHTKPNASKLTFTGFNPGHGFAWSEVAPSARV